MSKQEPLVFVQAPEKVVSNGFLQHDLTTCSALLVFRPGSNIIETLKVALAFFSETIVEMAVQDIAEEAAGLTNRKLN
jgi:hypothetical protein